MSDLATKARTVAVTLCTACDAYLAEGVGISMHRPPGMQAPFVLDSGRLVCEHVKRADADRRREVR